MCGRGRSSSAPERLVEHTGTSADQWRNRDRYRPSYNIGPGGWIPVLRRDAVAQTILHTMKWGLVPSFTKKGAPLNHYRMFNARSERLKESPVFRRLLKGKRCVVLMNGFYEWRREGAAKQPYYIHRGEDNLVRMAGLYDRWQPEDSTGDAEDTSEEEAVYSVSIITTDAGPRLGWLHNRMPVILPDEAATKLWLSGADTEWTDVEALLKSYDAEDLVYHPVPKKMGSIKFQGRICCEDTRQKGIAALWRAARKEEAKEKREEPEEADKTPRKKIKLEAEASTSGRPKNKRKQLEKRPVGRLKEKPELSEEPPRGRPKKKQLESAEDDGERKKVKREGHDGGDQTVNRKREVGVDAVPETPTLRLRNRVVKRE